MASRPPKKRSSFKREEPVGISIDIAVEKIRALPNPTTVKGIRELFPMPWIFLGEQPLRVRTLFRWLETRVGVRPNTGRVCPTSDLQSTSTLQTILGDLRSPSLFSPVSLLMVSEAENLRVAIAEHLSAVISVSAHSITLFSGRPTIRKEVLERLGGTIFNVPEFNDEQLSRWIEKEAQKCGGSGIESEAIHRLVRFFGRDLGGLSQEIEKLVLSSPKGARIKGELVEATSIPTSDRDSFLLVRKIAAHDTAGSVELCRRMVAGGFHPLQLLSFLAKCYRVLAARHGLSEAEGKSLPSELSSYYYWKELGPISRSFKPEDLSNGIGLLAELDLKLKSSGLEPELSTELAIQRLAGRRPTTAAL